VRREALRQLRGVIVTAPGVSCTRRRHISRYQAVRQGQGRDDHQKVLDMEEGYTQLGTVLTDQRPGDTVGDGVIVVGRFKGGLYDGVQLSYDA
jgi:hypothetical protein